MDFLRSKAGSLSPQRLSCFNHFFPGDGIAREKIIIVDDSSDIIEILVHHTLAALEYDTVSALNGKDGSEKVPAEKPDLILLDLNMPYMSGFEMLHACHARRLL